MQPIASLNRQAVSREEFGDSLRPLFEAGEPLAEALYGARPFPSYAALIDRAEVLAHGMTREQQAAVLGAHPRIGANPAEVSALSYREQGYAADASADAAQLERTYAALDALNRAYEDRFGFRFVVFVNRRPKAEIVKVLEDRLHNPPEQELETGLREMFLIARNRLAGLGE